MTDTVVKEPVLWFTYFTNYHTTVNEFKAYYDALIVEAQELQKTNNDLKNTNVTLIQQQTQLEIQLC